MTYDPFTTFAIYLVIILGLFSLIAMIADLWLAHSERQERHQARAEARAKRMEERDQSLGTWQ